MKVMNNLLSGLEVNIKYTSVDYKGILPRGIAM